MLLGFEPPIAYAAIVGDQSVGEVDEADADKCWTGAPLALGHDNGEVSFPRTGRVCALVVAVGAICGSAMSAGGAGPIKSPSGSWGQSFDVAVSSQAWDGNTFVKNEGPGVAILDSVRLIGRDPKLRFVGAYTHRKKTPYDVSMGGDRGWPPNKLARPYRRLRGTRVPPASTLPEGMDGVQILIRVRAPAKPAVVGYKAIDVRYHVGHHRYRARFNGALTLCARPRGKAVDCDVR